MDQRPEEGRGCFIPVKTNANGADIDNDDVVQNHEDEDLSLIRVLIDAKHFFKTKETDTLALIKKHCTKLLEIQNDQQWGCFYNTQAASLEAKVHPTLEAIRNVFALASSAIPRFGSSQST